MFLSQLFESTIKHASFCFGRMNPPTLGHGQLINTVAQASQGGDYFIFASGTQDKKKNPLDYTTKIKFLKAMFPEQASHIVNDPTLKTIMQVAEWLYAQGYRSVTFVAGSDRLDGFKQLLTSYNGVEGKSSYYKFDSIKFASSGERDPDAEGIAGVSASSAREAASQGNLEAFAQATGAGKLAEPLYQAVRKGMLLEGWGYSPSRNIKREIEYEKKQKEKAAAYREANPVGPKPTKTLQRLQRIQGFDKVSPEEQMRVAKSVDAYLARGMTFDQALVLAQKSLAEATGAGKLAEPLYDAVRKGMLLINEDNQPHRHTEVIKHTVGKWIVYLNDHSIIRALTRGIGPRMMSDLITAIATIPNLEDKVPVNGPGFWIQDNKTKSSFYFKRLDIPSEPFAVRCETGVKDDPRARKDMPIFHVNAFSGPEKPEHIKAIQTAKHVNRFVGINTMAATTARKIQQGKLGDNSELIRTPTTQDSQRYNRAFTQAKKLDKQVDECSGYIPKNKKEAKDPRWSTALTVDVHPDTPTKNMKALRLI